MILEPCTSSGLKSSSTAICAAPGLLVGITLIQAAAAATLIIYDNASAASGTVLAQLNTTINTDSKTITFDMPVFASQGIYAAVTGTSAGYIVHYQAHAK